MHLNFKIFIFILSNTPLKICHVYCVTKKNINTIIRKETGKYQQRFKHPISLISCDVYDASEKSKKENLEHESPFEIFYWIFEETRNY